MIQGNGKHATFHMNLANVAKRTSDLEDILSTELPGNSPIWITRRSESEIYLNDARVDGRKRNFQVKNSMGLDQVLHVSYHFFGFSMILILFYLTRQIYLYIRILFFHFVGFFLSIFHHYIILIDRYYESSFAF